jgi:hypothetical protein
VYAGWRISHHSVFFFGGFGVCIGAGFAGRSTIIEPGCFLFFPAIGAGSLAAGLHLPAGQGGSAVEFGAGFLAVPALIPAIPAVNHAIGSVRRWRRRGRDGHTDDPRAP